MLLSLSIIYVLKCSHRLTPAPSSFHLPLLSLHPPLHAMSIAMCKGHPGNREAAVDREINKQKKRERSDGGQSPVIHRVNCRPTSHKPTPNAPSPLRPLLSLYAGLYGLFSLLCHSSFSPSPSFPCVARGCCARLPVCSPSRDRKHTQAEGVVETVSDRRVNLRLPGAGCF